MKDIISMVVVCLATVLWGCGGAQQEDTTPEPAPVETTSEEAPAEEEPAPISETSDPETTEEVIETSTPL